MIRKITLENFMSHKRTVIEPAEGRTLLTGENNCGKSAIAVALEAVSGHTLGNYMLRHGEKNAKVVIELENEDGPHTIEWHRNKESQGWSVDDLDDDRFEPDNLHDILRLPQIESETGTHKYQLHIASQKDPIFLLDKPGSRAAEFFAGSGDSVHLLSMRQLHKKKAREKTTEATLLKKQINAQKSELQKLEPLSDIRKSVASAKKRDAELKNLQERREQLAKLLKSLERNLCESLQKGMHAKQFQPLMPPPALEETSALSKSIQDLGSTGIILQRLNRKTSGLNPLPDPPEQTDASPLQTRLRNLQQQQAVLTGTQARHRKLTTLAEPPGLTDTDKLSDTLASMKADRTKLKQASTAHDTAVREEEDAREHFKQLESEGAICDQCGAPLTYEHLTRDVHDPMLE